MPNTADADAINPEALKTYRKKAGYQTQGQLAEKLGCRVDQVNRWETGRTKKPRPHLLNKLTEALGVGWEGLTRPPKTPEKEEDSWFDPTIQLNRRVRKSTRTALELVRLVYGVRWRDILELAPLLFFICAQQSLTVRKKALEDAVEQIEQAVSSANSSVSYMHGAFRDDFDYEWIEKERSSIKNRCVFECYYDADDVEQSPFVNHLNELLQGFIEDEMEISPNGPWAPHYEFPVEILQQITGISGDGEKDEAILHRIQQGHLDLQEVRSKKAELDAEEYRVWLEDTFRKVEAEIKAKHPLPLLNLGLFNRPDKSDGAENTTAPEEQK